MQTAVSMFGKTNQLLSNSTAKHGEGVILPGKDPNCVSCYCKFREQRWQEAGPSFWEQSCDVISLPAQMPTLQSPQPGPMFLVCARE